MNKKYGKRIRQRLYSFTAAGLVLAIAAVTNLCAQTAEKKFGISVDLTREKVFELSAPSAAFIETVEKPVEITVMMDERTLEKGGGYFTQAKQILDQFGKINPKISVSYIDLVKNPSYASAFPKLELNYYDIVLNCGGKTCQTALTELFVLKTDGSTGKRYIESSQADEILTSAIMRLTTDETPRICLLTGHDEQYTQELISLLEIRGFEVVLQNPLTQEIENSTAVVISLAPKKDYEEDVLERLDSFLVNGKEYGRQFFYAPGESGVELTNLETYIRQWGIEIGSRIIVESNPQRIVNNLSYMCLVDYASPDYTDKLTTSTMILSPLGREIKPVFEAKNGYMTEALLAYSADSCAVPFQAASDSHPLGEDFGVHPALLRSSFTQYSDGKERKSSIFVFAAPGFFEDSILYGSSVANAEYFSALLDTVTEREDSFYVPPKHLGGQKSGITRAQLYGMGIAFIPVIPAFVMLAGLLIWRRRKMR